MIIKIDNALLIFNFFFVILNLVNSEISISGTVYIHKLYSVKIWRFFVAVHKNSNLIGPLNVINGLLSEEVFGQG
jgi:hypothetical protein